MPGRYLFHLDLDEFIAAVERLRHPELEGKPIVVGGDGDPTKRGVVSTASYEARVFGIRSAMPLRTAYKRNPDAIFLAVDADAYLETSSHVMDTLRTFDAEVEVAGWDEAFLAVAADDPETLAREIQQRVLRRTRLWCTIGIGDNRLQAKLASGFGKPRGVFVLTSDQWNETMFGLTTSELWGIGSKTAAKLADLGIRTVGELAEADEAVLAERFGPSTGPWLASLGRGEGSDRVHPEGWTRKGLSKEHTFQVDLTDPARDPHRGGPDRARGRGRSPRRRLARRPRRREGAVRALLHDHPRCHARRADRGSRTRSPTRPDARSSGSSSTGRFGSSASERSWPPPVVQDGG